MFFDYQKQMPYFLTFILLVLSFFWNLGGYPLMDNNEGLYARVSVEMLASSNWVIPHLNAVPYMEKPPLFYWLVALCFKLFGISEAPARLVPALSGFSLCMALMYWLRRLGAKANNLHQVAWMAPLILGTSIIFVVISRTVYFDMLFSCLFAWALVFFFFWCETEQKRDLYLGYAFLALATLTKGLLAPALGGLVMLSYFIVLRMNVKRIWHFLWNVGPLLYLLIAAPWHVMAHYAHADFSWFFFINEHWNRFLDQRLPKDYYNGPIYYYVPRMLGYLVPWTGALVCLKHAFGSKVEGGAGRNLIRFCWTWFLSVLIFFSVSKAKANYYMVAGLAPLVVLIALGIAYSASKRSFTMLKIFSFSFWAIFAAAFAFLMFRAGIDTRIAPYEISWGLDIKITISIIFLLIGAGIFVAKDKVKLVLLTACIGCWAVVLVTHAAKGFSDEFSSKNAMLSIPESAFASKNVYMYHDYESISTSVFYAKQPLIMINSGSSDLLFGKNKGTRPDLFITMDQFEHVLASQKSVYVVVRPSFKHVLEDTGLCQKGDFKKRLVYSNRCEN